MELIDTDKAKEEALIPKHAIVVKDDVTENAINEFHVDNNDGIINFLTLSLILALVISFIIFRIKKTKDKIKKNKCNNKDD
ncbi:hypothetical protein CPT_Machias_237 [Staphylococcus phage Machias]|nr:hypothetical protein CPT_Machias_237 [Staphylococcus phage Machias]WPH64233.1 hypothetical protein [Staphylococcus phage vB_StaM_PB50]